MNSIERRKARYNRRKAKRETKRFDKIKNNTFDLITDPDKLYKAAKDSRKGVYWKASVQRYWMNILRNIYKTNKDLKAGHNVHKGFIEFKIRERGKVRHIRSVQFSERVVQKSLCTNILIPHLSPSLIHDNGASIANKGISFAVKRLKVHLSRHFRHHGRDGYVLLVDFRKYFDHILHEPLRGIYVKSFGNDEKLLKLAMQFVYAFGESGIGLGSETSQINAVVYSSANDHYIKEVLECKFYGRYMDDSYFICKNKEQAQKILSDVLSIYDVIGIKPNPNKTMITKLSKGFTFLKTRFSLTETGKIVARPERKSVVRQRRKLKKLKKFLDDGKISIHEIRNSYMSWRGYILNVNARRTVHSMDNLYTKLFGMSPLIKLPKD